MERIILSINAGSSSVKVSVYSFSSARSPPRELASVQISGLTSPPAKLTYDRGEQHHVHDEKVPSEVTDQSSAFQHILSLLVSDAELEQVRSASDISFAVHRIVHGGDFAAPQALDSAHPETLRKLQELSDLAPLHNGPALGLVQAVREACPDAQNVACFDSAFHAGLPAAVRTYAVDPEVARANGLRKYGFHGLSYAFVARSCAAHLAKAESGARLIALHLGSGASACAIGPGPRSLDTSMGLTPLAGLPGATRSGDVDPSLIFHLTHDAGRPSAKSAPDLPLTRAEEILNSHSGWKALAGTSDFGEISKKAAAGDEACALAFDLFVDRIVGFVGSYFVKLHGDVDALVFAGGIGEKGAELRAAVVDRVRCLGFELDADRNTNLPDDGVVVDVGKRSEGARRVLVCRTDEQVEMATQCIASLERLEGSK